MNQLRKQNFECFRTQKLKLNLNVFFCFINNVVFAGPTEVMVEQTGIERVQISWNAPSSSPSPSSYRITINSTSFENISSPFNIPLPPGVYSMQLVALSHEWIYEVPSPVVFTVQGKDTLASDGSCTHITSYTLVEVDKLTLYHRIHASRSHHFNADCHLSYHILDSARPQSPSS